MRIALIAHVFGLGDGQGRVNYEIVRAALDNGVPLTLIAEDCAQDLAQQESIRFIRIAKSTLPTRFLKNLSFAFRTAGWLRRNRKEIDVIQANGFVTFARVDVVAAHFVHGAWLKSPYASVKGKRLTLRALYQRVYTVLNAWLEQLVFRRAERVIAISGSVANELRSVGVPEQKIVVIFNGVDSVEFQPRGADRSSFSLPGDVVLFLFSGDIRTHRKNLDGVLRALAEVEGVHLAVAGGVEGSPFPALAKELGVGDRVHFLGYVSGMSKLMAAVDAFIFPSRYDPMGLVVLEAMASGLPVITAETTGAHALLDQPAWTVKDPEDVAGLARMIRLLAEDPQLRKQLGEANRKKSLMHTWTAMAESYVALHRQIFEEKSRKG